MIDLSALGYGPAIDVACAHRSVPCCWLKRRKAEAELSHQRLRALMLAYDIPLGSLFTRPRRPAA